jgi:uncharacterized membrane protein
MNNKVTIPKQIIILLILAVLLNLGRISIFHSTYFIYLLWNIFLAILPFVISYILLWSVYKQKLTKPFFIITGIFWLLLIPNAPYIVTDLIHMGRGRGIPLLYDTFLIFSSAWVGLLLGMHSIFHIEKIIKIYYGKRIASIKIPIIIGLISIGVYIGRYLRFNSWDIFVDHSFFGDTISNLSQPVHLNEAIIFILSCFVFLYLSYRAWKYTQDTVV